MKVQTTRAGLVLGGGGMRGAYGVGVLSGIMEVLERAPEDDPPFRIFAGTSVGAINAAFLAANAHRGDMNLEELVRLWTSLRLAQSLRFRTRGLLRMIAGGRSRPRKRPEAVTRSLVVPRFLERVLYEGVDWQKLHDNVSAGKVRALAIAALEIASGLTTVFAELAPGAAVRPSNNPQRQTRETRITVEHVLASSAIPLLFPAREIEGHYYCDGGLRFNTPIAPAIRCGADRLVVISLKRNRETTEAPSEAEVAAAYPSLPFLLGKLLNALLLDPVTYDLQVLKRFNQLVEILERSLRPEELLEVEKLMVESRGDAYRRIEHIVFTPTRDIGVIATEHAGLALARPEKLGWLGRTFLENVAAERYERAGDLASYLLFDGEFAQALIALGRSDVRARAAEVAQFFEREEEKEPATALHSRKGRPI